MKGDFFIYIMVSAKDFFCDTHCIFRNGLVFTGSHICLIFELMNCLNWNEATYSFYFEILLGFLRFHFCKTIHTPSNYDERILIVS